LLWRHGIFLKSARGRCPRKRLGSVMAVTEPSQNPISDGLAILISCHALAQNIRRTSSGSLAMFTAIRCASSLLSSLAAREIDVRERFIENDTLMTPIAILGTADAQSVLLSLEQIGLEKGVQSYFSLAPRSTPAVGTSSLEPRLVCFVKHLSPVFTASGP